jgi:glycopeptide antibiotics resistance protein
MPYAITRTKRNSIILCSSFLILHVLYSRLILLNGVTKIDTIEILVRNVTYLIPFGFLMWVFFNYFKHYRLKVLQNSILIIFIMEVILRSTFIPNTFEWTWNRAVLLSASTIWIAATIILIVVLFRNKTKVYPGTRSIRNYALVSLLIYVFSTTYSFYIKPVNPLNTMLVVGMTNAIPFIFTIDFALKTFVERTKTRS